MTKDELIDLLTKVRALLLELAPVGTTDENQYQADMCYDYAAKLNEIIKEQTE